jgi:hypothetical protein
VYVASPPDFVPGMAAYITAHFDTAQGQAQVVVIMAPSAIERSRARCIGAPGLRRGTTRAIPSIVGGLVILPLSVRAVHTTGPGSMAAPIFSPSMIDAHVPSIVDDRMLRHRPRCQWGRKRTFTSGGSSS